MNFITKIYKEEKHVSNLSKEDLCEVLKQQSLSDNDIKKINEKIDAGKRVEQAVCENNYDFDIKQVVVVCCPNVFSKKDIKRNSVTREQVFAGMMKGNAIGLPYNTVKKKTSEIVDRGISLNNSEVGERAYLILAVKSAIEENSDKPNFKKHFALINEKVPSKNLLPMYADRCSQPSNLAACATAYIGACYEDVRTVILKTVECASILNRHRDSIIGAVVSAVSIWMALHNYSDKEIYEYGQKMYSKKEEKYLYLFDRQDMFETIRSAKNYSLPLGAYYSNYASVTVPLAIKMFYETKSFKECMFEFAKKYGDVEAYCTIAGGLATAYYDGDISLSEEL